MKPSAAWPGSCDVLIAGGGLAGLLLAAGLADEKFSALRICVAEPRLDYVRDRTWSYWRQAPHALSHLERCTWAHWSVAHAGRTLACAAPGWVYATVDADAVYAHALQKIRASQHVQLMQGWVAKSLQAPAQLEQVGSGQRHEMKAKRVIDATARVQAQPGDLVQQFVGWEVRCEQAVFEPKTVQLMHFEAAQEGVHFMYVLPYDAHSALIETTWISPLAHKPEFEREMHQATQRYVGGAPYEVVYREQGCLPLVIPPKALSNERVIALGRAGAALRPSTGYAFLNTMTQVNGLLAHFPQQAQQLGAWQPEPFELPAAQRWMDAVFLREMQSAWEAVPARFMAMFEHVPPDALMRFLSGQEGWADRLHVMRALPVRPYVQAAWQHTVGA